MALEDRVATLEREVRELAVLVDGQEPWSHRKRLHALENNDAAAKYNEAAAERARQALAAYRRERARVPVQVREWGSFALALAAVLVTLLR